MNKMFSVFLSLHLYKTVYCMQFAYICHSRDLYQYPANCVRLLMVFLPVFVAGDKVMLVQQELM